ncbi:hypothetical protein WJX74_001998 [Apatococcus lobatus]|uniref:J domain-containing protein n=1 Tax=Apatococcus lobatus TaxID=904363 RepID=A0AAW1QXQ1_9CHLO
MRALGLSFLLPSPRAKPRLGHIRQGRPSGLSKGGACHALNPWKTLEVEEGASHKEIKRAYRKLALRHHPDVQGSEEEFLDIQHAYQTLIDRARGQDSSTERRGGWNFHDWYWQFRQDRTWGGKKRQQQGHEAPKATGPTEAELASQLAGLRQRASSRKPPLLLATHTFMSTTHTFMLQQQLQQQRSLHPQGRQVLNMFHLRSMMHAVMHTGACLQHDTAVAHQQGLLLLLQPPRKVPSRPDSSFGHDIQSKHAHMADELVTYHSRSQRAHAFSAEAGLSAEATHPHLTYPWSVGADHTFGSPAHYPQHQHAEPHVSAADNPFQGGASHARPTAESSSHATHIDFSRAHRNSQRTPHHRNHSPDSSSASHLSNSSAVTAVASHTHDEETAQQQQQHSASNGSSSSSSGRSSTSGSHSFGSDPHVGSQLDGLRRRSAMRKSR